MHNRKHLIHYIKLYMMIGLDKSVQDFGSLLYFMVELNLKIV